MMLSTYQRPALCQLISLTAFSSRPAERHAARATGKDQSDSSSAWKEQLAVRQAQLNLGGGKSQNGESLRKGRNMVEVSEFGDTIDASILEEDDEEMGMESWMEEGDFDLEEEIFSLDSQVSEADLGAVIDAGWGVEDLEDAGEDDEDGGWGVSAVETLPSLPTAKQPETEEKQEQKRKTWEAEEVDEKWRSTPALRALNPLVLKKLQGYQEEADRLYKETQKLKGRKTASETKTHRRLRVISGDFAGKRLLSGMGETTRPMMEKVRAATFSMLLSRCGGLLRLPEESKWLDLFAGTGSVGLEALSRGAQKCDFIEMEPWVVNHVLRPNLESCGTANRSMVHIMKAEEYLERALAAPEYATSFDFISVCPPYLKVSYDELFGLLEKSPLLHEETHMVVEYPTKTRFNLPDAVGPLRLLKDRKFGRTRLALFGPE